MSGRSNVATHQRPAVVVTATRRLARFLSTAPPRRDPDRVGLDVSGRNAAVDAFLEHIGVFPFGGQASEHARPWRRHSVVSTESVTRPQSCRAVSATTVGAQEVSAVEVGAGSRVAAGRRVGGASS
jgi:hypothetical protein